MYAIVHGNEIISICEKPTYIKIKPNTGIYIEATPEEASGIAVAGKVYNLGDKVILEGADSVRVIKDNTGKWIYKNYNSLVQTKQELEKKNQTLVDCILEMSEVVYS